MTPVQVVVAGGGTGGHVYPGIAIAREVLARRPGARVSFVGTAQGLEATVVPREGFELDVIRSAGLKGKSWFDRLRGAALVPVGLADAWRVLSARRPRVVIGVGGYSAGPAVLCAWVRGTPTLLVEPNAVPGLTNRMLAPVVNAAAVAFESTRRYLGDKAFVSGNPVRAEFVGDGAAREASRAEGVNVLVFGGSQGAHAINVAMVSAAPRLVASGARLRLTHQTGTRDVELVREGYRAAGLEADVQPYLHDMGRRLIDADLVICRAGATTLAEVTAAGRAAILIPLPTATDDHQRSNALALVSAGAAELLLQSEATGDVLADRLLALAGDRERRRLMEGHARGLAKPDAARVIVEHAFELMEG